VSEGFPINRTTRQGADIIAAAAQTDFTTNYPVLDALDLAVRIKPVGQALFGPVLAYSANYDVLNVGLLGGATVRLFVPCVAGDIVRIKGRRVGNRTTSVTRNGSVRSASIEKDLDLITITLQELRRDVDAFLLQSVRAPEGETFLDLPPAALRATRALIFDSFGALALAATNTVSTIISGNITDSSAAGRALLTAANALVQRNLLDVSARKNIIKFGALGNGVSDDQPSIAATHYGQSFRQLIYPEADYLIGNPLWVDGIDNRQFIGEGSKIIMADGFAPAGGQGGFTTFGASAAARRKNIDFFNQNILTPATLTAVNYCLRFLHTDNIQLWYNKLENLETGGIGAAYNGSNRNSRHFGNDIIASTYGTLFKPTFDLVAILTDTNQNEYIQIIGDRYTSDAAKNGQISLSLDTSTRRASILGIMASGYKNTAGLGVGAGEGMGVAIANENDDPNRCNHILVLGAQVHDYNKSAIHFEDGMRDQTFAFLNASEGRFGVRGNLELKADLNPEAFDGIMVIGTSVSDMKDCGVAFDGIVAGAKADNILVGLDNMNYVGHTPLVAGTGAGTRMAFGATGEKHIYLPGIKRGIIGKGFALSRVNRSVMMPQIITSTDYALRMDNIPVAGSFYVQSGSVLDGTAGPVDPASDRLVGDRSVSSRRLTLSATNVDVLMRAALPGWITAIHVIYEDAGAGPASPVLNVATALDFTNAASKRILNKNLLNANVAGASEVYNLGADFQLPLRRRFAAGDIIAVQTVPASGANTHSIRVQIDFFYYQ